MDRTVSITNLLALLPGYWQGAPGTLTPFKPGISPERAAEAP